MTKFSFSTVLVSLIAACASSATNRGISMADAGMEYVKVCDQGGICRNMSRLIMGTDHLGQSDWTHEGQRGPSDAEIFKVLDEAAKLGINFFDTAPIYVGDIENRLGSWMKSRESLVTQDNFYAEAQLNPDRKLYALSKGGFPFDLYWAKELEAGTHSKALKDILRQEGVLKSDAATEQGQALKLDNVPAGTYSSRLFGDVAQIHRRVTEEIKHTTTNLNNNVAVYLMHRDDGDYLRFNEVKRSKTPVRNIMEALSVPTLGGKFGLLGWSNWDTARVNESIALAKRYPHLKKPNFNSPYFSLFEMSQRSIHAGGVQVTHAEMMDPSFQKGIKLNPYSPLGGFSFLDQPEPRWENAKRVAKKKYDAGDAYWQNVYHAIFTDANKARYDRAVAFTEQFNKKHGSDYSLDQMLNAYALAHPRMDFLTVGPITVEQLRRTVASLKLARMLTVQDLEYLYHGTQK